MCAAQWRSVRRRRRRSKCGPQEGCSRSHFRSLAAARQPARRRRRRWSRASRCAKKFGLNDRVEADNASNTWSENVIGSRAGYIPRLAPAIGYHRRGLRWRPFSWLFRPQPNRQREPVRWEPIAGAKRGIYPAREPITLGEGWPGALNKGLTAAWSPSSHLQLRLRAPLKKGLRGAGEAGERKAAPQRDRVRHAGAPRVQVIGQVAAGGGGGGGGRSLYGGDPIMPAGKHLRGDARAHPAHDGPQHGDRQRAPHERQVAPGQEGVRLLAPPPPRRRRRERRLGCR
eukprot:1087294-Prorocentrum_minimum.AAC.3